jgi:hypothetical protein
MNLKVEANVTVDLRYLFDGSHMARTYGQGGSNAIEA